MKKIILFCLLISYSGFCQTVYQASDVEKAAAPKGGVSILNQFINSNLQIPFRSSVNGLNKKVFVKGIVEPDGSMTDVQVIKGIDSLCDKEAVRVMSLFHAWQPGVVKGEKVRQFTVYHVTFKAEPRPNFDSTRSALVDYYDGKYAVVQDQNSARYRSIIPLNEKGYLNGDIVYEELQFKKWNKIASIPFKHESYWMPVYETGVDSVLVDRYLAEDKDNRNYVPFMAFQKNGKLLMYTEYDLDSKKKLVKTYYLNGMLKEMESFGDNGSMFVSWYTNGQIRNIQENVAAKPDSWAEPRMINAWDPNGDRAVSDGNGHWKLTNNDGTRLLQEEGSFVAGLKNGKWVGKKMDGTLFYEETYDNGKLLSGYSLQDGVKKTYSTSVVQPQFKGGLNELYKFLGQNIQYPDYASRKNITGRVYMTFVVCEDGSLCDYKVLKGVQEDIDTEALRVVKKMSGRWEPGVQRGQKVRVKYNLPINFMLN